MTPSLTKYIATNSDGSVYAFSCEPEIITIPTGRKEDETVEVWEPIDEDGCYKFLKQKHPDLFWKDSMIHVEQKTN